MHEHCEVGRREGRSSGPETATMSLRRRRSRDPVSRRAQTKQTRRAPTRQPSCADRPPFAALLPLFPPLDQTLAPQPPFVERPPSVTADAERASRTPQARHQTWSRQNRRASSRRSKAQEQIRARRSPGGHLNPHLLSRACRRKTMPNSSHPTALSSPPRRPVPRTSTTCRLLPPSREAQPRRLVRARAEAG